MTRIDNIRKQEGFKESERLTELMERLDNDHLKFEDFQTMIQSSQQRIEQLYETIKLMENSVLQFNVVEESYNAKLVDRHHS